MRALRISMRICRALPNTCQPSTGATSFALRHRPATVTSMNQRQLDEFLAFLRFPSISTDPAHKADVNACAEWLAAKLRAMGLMTALHPTAGHPIVVAKNAHVAGRRTVMIYGHYDVQPVDPLALWDSPPFEPRVADGYVFARGSADNKGQHFAHVLGIEETLRENRELPVNLILLIEGEEEIGSEHLEGFLA